MCRKNSLMFSLVFITFLSFGCRSFDKPSKRDFAHVADRLAERGLKKLRELAQSHDREGDLCAKLGFGKQDVVLIRALRANLIGLDYSNLTLLIESKSERIEIDGDSLQNTGDAPCFVPYIELASIIQVRVFHEGREIEKIDFTVR